MKALLFLIADFLVRKMTQFPDLIIVIFGFGKIFDLNDIENDLNDASSLRKLYSIRQKV